METLREMRAGADALGMVGDGVSSDPVDELAGRRTILDAIRSALVGAEVGHAVGPGSRTGRTPSCRGGRRARARVRRGDRGPRRALRPHRRLDDRRVPRPLELGFIGRQQELLEAVVATGTPVVLVRRQRAAAVDRVGGRALRAVLLAWVPGDAGPDAIAAVLTGAVNPGGKLPVSVPRHVGQVPMTYRHHPTGGHSQPKGDYVDGPVAPLWPFGHGLSYTSFRVDRPARRSRGDRDADGE